MSLIIIDDKDVIVEAPRENGGEQKWDIFRLVHASIFVIKIKRILWRKK